MRKIWMVCAAILCSAAWVGAAVFQDWSQVEPKKNVGTYADENGSKLELSSVAGPKTGEKALQVKSSIIQWGGVWVAVDADLSKAGAIKFSAKSSVPCILQVGLTDEKKTAKVAQVRILSNDWEEFTIPLSRFEKTKYPMKDAPKGAEIVLSKIGSFQIQPQTQGTATLWIGPLSTAGPGATAHTGLADPKGAKVVVQDFALLGKNACGPYADKESGTSINLSVEKDPDAKGYVGAFKYDLKNCGWCGYWMRSGDFWGGQDWRGAQTLTLDVYSTEPTALMVSFNDGNQNSYSALTPKTKGAGWETVTVPFSKFKLDEYYQRPEAKEGAPQDLSRIESFNIAPKTTGVHSFKIREVAIHKK